MQLGSTTGGGYTVTQLNAIDHPTPGLSEENLQFTVNYTVTDGDGDTATGTLAIDVDDDTPTINVTQTAITRRRSATTPDAASESRLRLTNVFGLSQPSDGCGSARHGAGAGLYAEPDGCGGAGFRLDSNGVQINLYDVGGVIVGSTALVAPATITDPSVVFSIAVDSSGVVTLTQHSEIDHTPEVPSGAPFDDQLAVLGANLVRLTASATSPTATESATTDIDGSNIQFADDGPSVVNVNNLVVELDDENLLGGNAGGDDPIPLNATGTLDHAYGADGAGTTLLTGAVLPSADFSASVDVTGTLLTITQISTGLAVIQVQLGSTTGGGYTVTQLNAIDHPTPGLSEENLQFTVNYTVTDGDGDTATGTLAIDVDDDTPTVASNLTVFTDDETATTPDAAPNLGGTTMTA